MKQIFPNSPLFRVSDPVATTIAVEGGQEALALAPSHVPYKFSSTLPCDTAASQFGSNTLATFFRFGATANIRTISAQSQRPIFNFTTVHQSDFTAPLLSSVPSPPIFNFGMESVRSVSNT